MFIGDEYMTTGGHGPLSPPKYAFDTVDSIKALTEGKCVAGLSVNQMRM